MSSEYRYANNENDTPDFDLKGCGIQLYSGLTLLPIEVHNSMPYMTPETVALSMQPAVSQSLADRRFTLKVDSKETEFRLGDFEFTTSPYEDGHSDEVTYKDSKGKNKTKVITTKGNLCFNETAVHEFIYKLAKEYGTPMVEPKYKISGEKLTVYKGTDGVGIDYNNLMDTIFKRIKADDYSPISTKIVTLTTPPVDIDKIYREVKCGPSNAYVTTDSAGNPKFTADIIGKDFDLDAARTAIQSSPDKSKWTIKLTLTYPEISLKDVRAPYCLDQKNGFMKAPVYLSSGSSEDYGGGICQVSTTLYCAALYANLQITERHNHIYVIHYWPTPGCDATVDWGHLDFRFRNNKDYPIKIKMSYENKKLTAAITGTKDGITVKLESEVERKVSYNTVYKRPNADNPEGKTVGGDLGKTIRVWKVIYQNGKLIEKKKLSYDLYNPLTKTIYTKNLPEGAEYS